MENLSKKEKVALTLLLLGGGFGLALLSILVLAFAAVLELFQSLGKQHAKIAQDVAQELKEIWRS